MPDHLPYLPGREEALNVIEMSIRFRRSNIRAWLEIGGLEDAILRDRGAIQALRDMWAYMHGYHAEYPSEEIDYDEHESRSGT